MDRKFAATFLLSFCVAILAASLSFAADRPYVPMEDRAVIPVKWAPVYGFGGSEDHEFASQHSPAKVELGPKSSATPIGTAVGTTTYDYQHNGTMGRQVEHRGTDFVHIDWMKQLAKKLGSGRIVGYNVIDLLNTCLADPGYEVGTDYGGYTGLDVWAAQSWAIPGLHSGADNDHMFPRSHWDFRAPTPGPRAVFSYEDHPTDVYGGYQEPNWGPNGLGANEHQNLWPIVEFQTGGSDLYLHMIACESGGAAGDPQTISYYRRTGPYGDDTLIDGSIIATWSGQCVIDTVEDISPDVTASNNSGQVAIAWTTPVDFRREEDAEFNGIGVQLCNDVWFVKSTNYGQDWLTACEDPTLPGRNSISSLIDMGLYTGGDSSKANGAYNTTWDDDGGNMTAYGWAHDWKAYTNVSALITTNEFLHVIWNGRRWTDTTSIYRRQSGIFHWSNDPASGGGTAGIIRTVAKALWDTGGTCYVGAWQSDLDKMAISECDGKLYTIWVQFGSLQDPCYDYESEDKFLNGDLYLSASGDAGFHWDRGDNLTVTETHLCDCGTYGDGANCGCENYPSMARFGRTAELCEGHGADVEVLDITYVNDLCAGGVVQDGRGIWSINDVMLFSTPCRDAIPEPAYADDLPLGGVGECFGATPLVIEPDGDTVVTFSIENTGLEDNVVTITFKPTIASTWFSVAPTSVTVGTGVLNNIKDIDMSFSAPAGSPDPAVYVCTMLIDHDALPKTIREVPVCMMVASVFARPRYAVVATPLKRVRIWNTGAIGGGGSDENFDYIDECDTLHRNVNADSYLYSASPIITRIDGNDTLRFAAYSGTYTDDDYLRPMGWVGTPTTPGTRDSVIVDSSTYANFTYARVEYATPDTLIGFWSEYFVPKGIQYGDFIVVRQSIWNRHASDTLKGVQFGEFLDWDIPTDFRTDTLTDEYDGDTYVTGNWSGWEKLDSIDVGGQWQYSGVLWLQGAEVNDSLEGDGSGPDAPYCATSIDHSTRYGGIVGDPWTPFANASNIDNASYIYRAGRTLEPGVIYRLMKNNVGFEAAHWEAASGRPDSEFVDLSMLVTFGTYDLSPGGAVNPRKYSNTFALVGTPGVDGDSATAYSDFIDLCKDALTWMQAQPEILLHCVDVPGDANGDGGINIGDAVYMGNYVFSPGKCAIAPPQGCPPECPPEGDANCDGALNIGDQVYLNNHVFSGGNAPCQNPPEKK